ncbi:hypothetical protein H4R34_005053, partial [Dimargaris verticillata]
MPEPALVDPVLLPLWRPRFPCSGIATTTTSLDGQAMEKAAASGVNVGVALVTAWAVLVSRYVDTSHIAVDLLGDSSENAANTVPKELAVPVSAESLVADVYRCVHSKVSLGQTAAEGIDSIDHHRSNALVFLGPSDALHEDDPWHSAMQRQHCSLLIRHAAGQASSLIHISYDQAMYADEAIQELAAQLSTVFAALLTALSAPAGEANVRVKDLPRVSAQQRERLLELATVSLTSKGGFPNPQDMSIQALFTQWAAKAPDQAALVHGKKALTYGELHHHVSALAYKLHSKY